MLVEKYPAGSCCCLWKTSPYFKKKKKCFYPVSLQVPTCNTCKIYCLILLVGKNAPVSTNLIANVVNKAVRSFYISVLQLPQTTRASHRFVFHLTLGLNPRPSEFWLEGSEGSVPPPLNRHDSLCDCENIDMPRLLIVYASPFPTTESHTRQNKFQTNVMQNVLWCLNFYLGFACCLKNAENPNLLHKLATLPTTSLVAAAVFCYPFLSLALPNTTKPKVMGICMHQVR